MSTATESKDQLYTVIQRIGKLSKDGVCVYDIGLARFTYINASLVKVLEVNKKVLVDDPKLILHLMQDEDQEFVMLRFAELREKEFLEDVQVRIAQNDVQKVLSINCYMINDNSAVVCFVRDITRPKEHEEYLVNFGAKKDAILDMVSQNLSGPLNLSRFTVDLIDKAVAEKKFHKLNSHITLMREITSECIRIIDDFLKEEHMVSPDIHIKANRFDLMSKVLIVLDQLKQSSPGKKIKLNSEIKHLFITGDDLKFLQILHNILSNSIKFTKSNGKIEVTVKNFRDSVEIIIQDDGIGIPENLQPYIFEKETRAGRPGLKGEISNGIGLYVSKKLTNLMGGKISFESKENKGTRFTLELPKE